MRHFTILPPLTLKGRKNKGLRGYAGKPYHPPLTDVPVTAYLFAAVFDVIGWVVRNSRPEVAEEMFHAATWLLLGGGAVSLLAALTGWADWARSSTPGTQARRTINTHAVIMIVVTVLVVVDLALRLTTYDDNAAPPLLLAVLSALAAGLVMLGSSYGGSLVFDYGFNVETSGDHPVWHVSEVDVFPGEKPATGDSTDSAVPERAAP